MGWGEGVVRISAAPPLYYDRSGQEFQSVFVNGALFSVQRVEPGKNGQ